MPSAIDLSGGRFGRLVALNVSDRRLSDRCQTWSCVCDCGQRVDVRADCLRYGHTQSCGCLKRELTRARRRTHGMARTAEYTAWARMIQRCTNPAVEMYPHYGGRGIRVCEAWRASFECFWADMGPRPSSSHSLDRIDNDGYYEPGNVRWATASVQQRNARPPSRKGMKWSRRAK